MLTGTKLITFRRDSLATTSELTSSRILMPPQTCLKLVHPLLAMLRHTTTTSTLRVETQLPNLWREWKSMVRPFFSDWEWVHMLTITMRGAQM